jgi:chitinase
LLSFLQSLRSTLGPEKKLSVCGTQTPFVGPDQTPLKDLTDFAQVLDWILIMNYDVWGGECFELSSHALALGTDWETVA